MDHIRANEANGPVDTQDFSFPYTVGARCPQMQPIVTSRSDVAQQVTPPPPRRSSRIRHPPDRYQPES